jgi:hypothetical protein
MADRGLGHVEILRHFGDRAAWIVAEIPDDVEIDFGQHSPNPSRYWRGWKRWNRADMMSKIATSRQNIAEFVSSA